MSGEKTIAEQIAEMDAAREEKIQESRQAVREVLRTSAELSERITREWGLNRGSPALFGHSATNTTATQGVTTGSAKKKN